jgi:hypothetical protein
MQGPPELDTGCTPSVKMAGHDVRTALSQCTERVNCSVDFDDLWQWTVR